MKENEPDQAAPLSGAVRRSKGHRDELLSRAGPILSTAEVSGDGFA